MKSTRTTHQDRANQYISQADSLRKQGRLNEAVQAYQNAIDLVPAFGSLNRVIGDIYVEMQAYPQAVEVYQALVGISPEDPHAWASLGKCYSLIGDFETAGAALDRAVELNPRDGDSFYYGAQVHVVMGDRKKAADYLEAALKLRPEWAGLARDHTHLKDLFQDFRGLSKLGQRKWWQFWKKKDRVSEHGGEAPESELKSADEEEPAFLEEPGDEIDPPYEPAYKEEKSENEILFDDDKR